MVYYYFVKYFSKKLLNFCKEGMRSFSRLVETWLTLNAVTPVSFLLYLPITRIEFFGSCGLEITNYAFHILFIEVYYVRQMV